MIARTWKQPRWPSIKVCIKKIRYVYAMGYYSAIKKEVFESVLVRNDLEPVIQSEVRKRKTSIIY